MEDTTWRRWGPVWLVVLLLPVAFVLLRSCLPPIGGPPPEPLPEPTEPPPVGSSDCGSCHEAQHRAWLASAHAGAEGPVPSFVPLAPDGTMVLAGASGEAPFPIERAIGRPPVVQLLVPSDGGRLQVTQRAFDASGEGFDVFGDARAPGDWGHWTGGGMTWNSQCASCHDTGVDKGWDGQRYETRLEEIGVGCAACHGPLGEHAQRGDNSGVAPVGAEVCAACHARRAELTDRIDPGAPFLDQFAPQLVDRTDAFYADGQVREEDFEYTAFLGSAMHEAGVTCTACHDPHGNGLLAEGDALCLRCHAAMPSFAPHDRHSEEAAPGCVGCHMPVTVYMQRDPRHDHGFVVPDPIGRARLGIPDPCDRCHADRGAAWIGRQATAWYGDLSSPRRERAEAVAAGRRRDPAAVEPLLRLLATERPAWRAAAADVLGGFVEEPRVRDGLRSALGDPDGHVRFAAVGALGGAVDAPGVEPAVGALLDDPVRAVRVAASRAMRHRLSSSDPRARDYASYLAHNADTPSALHERGTWAIARGDWGAAVRDLERAVALDPNAVALRDSLAVALSGAGRPEDAALHLQRAVELAPDDAELWFRLGLAEVGRGAPEASEVALERSVALDPGLVRAWYNLGLLRQQLGRGPEALEALRAAVRLVPDDPEVRYALASTLLSQGQQAAARQEAERMLASSPGHAGALAILGALNAP